MKITILAMAFAMCVSATANAQQGYPVRPIRIIVAYPAGSTTDITTRIVAQKISGSLGQPVIVENRPGANGAIAMQAVAKSTPDGYTLVSGSSSSAVIPSAMLKSLPFDLLKDFAPITLIANTTLVLTVNKESPINTVDELVAATKRSPGKSTYANFALFVYATRHGKIQFADWDRSLSHSLQWSGCSGHRPDRWAADGDA